MSFAILGQFLFGSDAGVKIGNVTLQKFEVPEFVRYGSKQELAIHNLPGGGKVVDSMGGFPGEVSWSGKIIGPDASDRASLLEDMCLQGDEIDLSFGDKHQQIVIKSFECEYRRSCWIGEYRISCEITDLVQDSLPPTLLGKLTSAFQSATGINLPGTLSTISGAIQGAQSALAVAGPIIGASSGVLAFQGALATANGVTGGLQAASEGKMGGLIVAANAAGGNVGGVAGLTTAQSLAEQLAKTTVIKGYLGQASNNLNGAI